MTKKRGKLKQLFIFNGLLLVVAFILIQYSVVKDDDSDTSAVADSEIEATYTQIMQNGTTGSKIGTPFDGRLQKYDEPFEPENIKFQNAMGKHMTLDSLKGQLVVLNFWASWCPPCIKEMPTLQALQDEYGGKGVQVVAIGLDRGIDKDKLRTIMQRYKFGPVAAYYGDWSSIKPHFEIDALPTTYILSPNGQALARVTGETDWISEDSKALIDGFLVQQ